MAEKRGNAGESSQASPFTPRTPNTSQEGPTVRIPLAPAESPTNSGSAAFERHPRGDAFATGDNGPLAQDRPKLGFRCPERPPRELRRWKLTDGEQTGAEGITLKLPYAPPYDWDAMIDFLGARAIRGIEVVDDRRCYRRSIALDGAQGVISVEPDDREMALRVSIRFPQVSALAGIVRRVRRIFDLSADPLAIRDDLGRDPLLAPLVAKRPGLRVPGAWDGFEVAVRAILGQQITVVAAVNLAAKLVAEYGEPLRSVHGDGLTHIFPTPDRIAQAHLLGMPAARARALSSVAAAALANPNLFSPSQTLEDAIAKLRSIPGIGEWTAQYIAMRVLCEPDAFPAADIGLLRALARSEEGRPSTAEVVARAEAWRPWRAYAAQHLWTADARTVRANKRINLKDNFDGQPSNAADPVCRSPRERDRNIASHP